MCVRSQVLCDEKEIRKSISPVKLDCATSSYTQSQNSPRSQLLLQFFEMKLVWAVKGGL